MSLSARISLAAGSLFVCLVLAAGNLWAQYTTGEVTGIVKDPSGAVVPDATVSLHNSATNATRAYTTGANGSYFFAAVQPGRYEVSAEAKGFAKVTVVIDVYASQTANQDLVLSLAGLGQSVQVTTEEGVIPTLNVTDPQNGVTRSALEVASLPIQGRDYLTLASLEPGVQPTFSPRGGSLAITSGSQAGSIAANGGRARETAFQLDYTDANDWEFGGRAQGRNLMPDAIQEFSVLTSNFSAEYGVKSAGQIIAVTKSGTNQFHGAAGDFVQNDVWNARDYFDRSGKATIIRSNNYSVAAGGPIIKNRAFIFGGYQGSKVRGAGFTSVALVPTQAARNTANDPVIINLMKQFLPLPTGATSDPNVGTFSSAFSSPTDTWQYVFKFDYRLTDSHSVSARYLQSHNHFLLLFPALNTLPSFDTDFTSMGNDVSLSDTYLFSPRTTNQFRFSYGRAPTSILGQNGLVSPRFEISGLVGFGALQFFPNTRLFNVFQVNDALTHTRGTHTFKTGFDVRKIQDNTFLATNANGFFTFASLNAFLNAQPSFWTQLFGPAYRGYRTGLYGFFFQDDWRVRPTLTVNLGIRFDVQGNMSEVNNLSSDLDPTTPGNIGAAGSGPLGIFRVGNPAIRANASNVGPRVGFAWNPRGGNFVVRGGYGIYYDSFDFTPLTFGRSVPPLNYNFSLTGSAISGQNSFGNIIKGTAPIVVQAKNQVGGFGNLTNFGGMRTLSRYMKNPYAQNFSLGVQYRFLRSYILNVGYIGTKGTHLTALFPINPVVRGPAPATSLADEAARLPQFQASLANQNGPGNTRLDPRFDEVGFQDSVASSVYHSVQIGLTKEFSREGLQFRASYTFSKSIDDASDFTPEQQANDQSFAQDGRNRRNERGPSNFDIPHRVLATVIWRIPAFKDQNGFRGRALGGWTFQSIQMWQSGVPGTALAGTRLGISDVNLDGDSVPGVGIDNTRANCTAGGAGFTLGNPSTIPPPNQRGINGALNSSNFLYTQPLLGNGGNCGRNTLRLNSLTSVDWSLFKSTRIVESGPLGSGPWNLEFRWEIYNILNIPYLAVQGNNWRTVSSPGFGLVNAAGATRKMQLALRLLW